MEKFLIDAAAGSIVVAGVMVIRWIAKKLGYKPKSEEQKRADELVRRNLKNWN